VAIIRKTVFRFSVNLKNYGYIIRNRHNKRYLNPGQLFMNRYTLQYPFIFLLAGVLSWGGCTSRQDGKESSENGTGEKEENDSVRIRQSREIIRSRTLGLAYLEENKLEEAEEEFKKLISLAPGEALGYANLGIVYMRMGNYEEAEKQLERAIALNPDDPDIRFNLAQVYDLANKEEDSRRELEKSIERSPDHLQSLYGLAESYQGQSDTLSINQWEKYLRKIVESSPLNIVARLYLIEAFIRNDRGDDALSNLEEIERISPGFPKEAEGYYQTAVTQLQSGNTTEALTSVRILHNLLKLTNIYQTDIQQLKGTGASRVGTPVISFSETRPAFLMEGESLLDALQFTDVTTSAALDVLGDLSARPENPIRIAVGDMDRDGDQDIYVSGYKQPSGIYTHYLLENNMGRFQDIAASAGIDHRGVEAETVFADYNNDGFLDIYIARQDKNLLYANVSEGVFREVGGNAGVADLGTGNVVLFFDMDQEGDLDLFLGNRNSIRVYLNKGDDTFRDISGEVAFGDSQSGCRDAVFGDMDDDGDVDLFLIREDGTHQLFANMRDMNFVDVTVKSGLENSGGSVKSTMGDYNNDGFPDLFIVGQDQSFQLFKNNGDGTFSLDQTSDGVFSVLSGSTAHDALFFDFDNDGFQDILTVGEPEVSGGSGVNLFHNDTKGKFKDVSGLLPDNIRSGTGATVFDYNEDGDMDILIAKPDGGVHLLRNDGGNANHHLKIQLVGIKTGSGKNNYFGIGAKIEVRAGELYQMKTVTDPNVHFGLGAYDKVDVVRILWTNGVPQNIFSPGSDQDLIEEQELKGSCPFLYTWNGEKYEFVKDMMWRSALGMPMGIMGKDNVYAFPDASVEYLKIPGEVLKSKDGVYSMQITSELWETIYFDKIRLVAVDHPEGEDIFVDESFTPPPFPELKIYRTGKKKYPRLVTDGKGRDLTSLVLQKDNQYISGFKKEKYQGVTELHELILEIDDVDPGEAFNLFLNGWIFPTDASINVSLSQSKRWKASPPVLQVQDEKGNWKTIIENTGFPMGKNKTMVVDLTGKLKQVESRIRILTSMEIYWDHIFFSTGEIDGQMVLNTLTPVYGDLHYRGFSAKFRNGGRYGPHWFDYDEVSTGHRWRDLTGYYTRYGDVLPLLANADNQYVIMNAGDEMTVEFKADDLPDLKEGWKRDFLIFSVGWVKDGDLNTAYGDMVGPLPYHGMSSYPYSETDHYPQRKELETYHKSYNTRKVTGEAFRNEIRRYGE
jgi:tetratricopeptide (TPR) repeat protein